VSSAVETSPGDQAAAARVRRLAHILPAFPAMGALVLAIAPAWSLDWALVGVGAVVVSILACLFVLDTDRYWSVRWRVRLIVSQFDLFALLAVTSVWRGFGSNPAFGVAAFGGFAATVLAARHYRRALLQQLLHPSGPAGVIVIALGSFGAGSAGATSYLASRTLPHAAGGVALFLASFLFVIVIHGAVAGADDAVEQPPPPPPS
jgi:hypothetical protein